MKIIKGLRQHRSKKKLVLTIGNFDGAHKGHQKIFKIVKRDGKRLKAATAALTFNIHPRKIIYRDRSLRLLNFLSHKLLNLEEAGLDYCVLVPFNQRTRSLSKETFLKRYIDPDKIVKVVVGYDFHFAKNRTGTVDDLAAYCRQHGIRFQKVGALKRQNKPISSGRVRDLVQKGELKEVRLCLGRPYSVIGTVVKGSGVGRQMDIRTANIRVGNELFPPEGVYFVQVEKLTCRRGKEADLYRRTGRKYCGLAYRGPLPKFNKRDNESIIEVFLFGFRGNLYLSLLEVSFIEFVRKPKKVKDIKSLKNLITRDIEKYRKRIKK